MNYNNAFESKESLYAALCSLDAHESDDEKVTNSEPTDVEILYQAFKEGARGSRIAELKSKAKSDECKKYFDTYKKYSSTYTNMSDIYAVIEHIVFNSNAIESNPGDGVRWKTNFKLINEDSDNDELIKQLIPKIDTFTEEQWVSIIDNITDEQLLSILNKIKPRRVRLHKLRKKFDLNEMRIKR